MDENTKATPTPVLELNQQVLEAINVVADLALKAGGLQAFGAVNILNVSVGNARAAVGLPFNGETPQEVVTPESNSVSEPSSGAIQ